MLLVYDEKCEVDTVPRASHRHAVGGSPEP